MESALGRALSPARLVILAWLGGAVTLLLALALDLAHTQERWQELAVLIWLAPLAAYDMRHREVPHMACVAVPCAAALVYSFLKGAGTVGAIALLAVAASERRVLRHARMERWAFSSALIMGGLLALASGEAAPGAFAVLAFWLAYEAGWWAGADALAAITLALLDQRVHLLITMGVAHGVALLAVQIARVQRLGRTRKAGTSRSQDIEPDPPSRTTVPGLPVIALTAVLLSIWDAAMTIALP